MPDWMTRRLELQGLDPWWAAAAHATAVLLAAGLICILHRYERQLVSRSIGLGLLSLRMAVLGLLLLTFLQPVQSWTINESRAGRIVIGIDQSQSMQTSDPQASRAEKLRWARGLGMIGNPAIAEQLDAWQAAFDQQAEPDWAVAAESPDPEQRQELADARKANLLSLFSELNELTRQEIARRLVVNTPASLMKQLEQQAKVELFVFAGKTESITAESMDPAWLDPAGTLQCAITDLAEAMQAGPSHGAATSVLGLVLFTDGRHTAKTSPLTAAAALGRLEIPVFPVLLGTTSRPKDLAIPSLDVPSTIYKGDKPLVKALLQTAGFEGQALTVILEPSAEDAPADCRQSKVVTPQGPLTPVEFELPGDEIGRFSYNVTIPVQEDETHRDNNTRAFTIAVVDDRAKVLLVDGEPRWEFRYLETAFARDDRVDLKTVLFAQPYLGLLPDTFFPRKLPNETPSPFENLDVVILGDVAPWQLTENHWNQLEQFVSDQGGTLILAAGKEYLPSAYQLPMMDRLLPLSTVQRIDLTNAEMRVPPSQRGLQLRLTSDADSQAMFRFAEDAQENRTIWESLPGPAWAWLGTAKPAATVWVSAFVTKQPALSEERSQSLIVHQHYGFGQVVWIGFDSTWRWRHRVGDKYHHQFWGQLVRWAASNKMAAGNEFVRFGPEQTEVNAGNDVVLRARWSPQFLQRFPEVTARVEITRRGAVANEFVSRLDIHPKKEQPILWETKLTQLPPGDYRARLVVKNGDLGPAPVEAAFSVRPPSTPELIDVTADRELLAQIAEASGGRLLFADELHTLPQLLRPDESTHDAYRETPLWDHSLMLLAFFTLLTGEWVLRKWNGLP